MTGQARPGPAEQVRRVESRVGRGALGFHYCISILDCAADGRPSADGPLAQAVGSSWPQLRLALAVPCTAPIREAQVVLGAARQRGTAGFSGVDARLVSGRSGSTAVACRLNRDSVHSAIAKATAIAVVSTPPCPVVYRHDRSRRSGLPQARMAGGSNPVSALRVGQLAPESPRSCR